MCKPTYRVKDWERLFENAQSRRYRKLSWFPVPNHYDTEGYAKLMGLENSMALYGAWIIVLGVASRMPVRGVLRRPEGPLGAPELAARSRGQAKVFKRLLRVLADAKYGIGWLELIPEDEAASLVAYVCQADKDNGASTPSVDPGTRSKTGSARSVPRPNRTEQKKKPAPVGADRVRGAPCARRQLAKASVRRDLEPDSVGAAPDRQQTQVLRSLQRRHDARKAKSSALAVGGLSGCMANEATTGESSDAWCGKFIDEVAQCLSLSAAGRRRQTRSLMAVARRLMVLRDRDQVLDHCLELAREKVKAGMRNPSAAWQAAIDKAYPRKG